MFFRRSKKREPKAGFRIPEGKRVYAIGDVHGRLDCFRALLDLIDQDDRSRPSASVELILLGDLVDRGPDSAGVVSLAQELINGSENVQLIKGNHEEVFVAATQGDSGAAKALIQLGGYATLESYGISRAEADYGTFRDLAKLLGERIPKDHVKFLAAGREMVTIGDYAFVHAGVRPGIPLDQQKAGDLRWIREPFLSTGRNDGHMVVHGHTPRPEFEERFDRIGIDTGAYNSGVLTAVGLEGPDRWFLQTALATDTIGL